LRDFRAYVLWEICFTKWIELAYSWEANIKDCDTVPFWPCFILYSRAISKYKLLGTSCCFDFGGLMFGGAPKWRCFLSEFYGINEELQ